MSEELSNAPIFSAGAPSKGPQYEFDASENEVFAHLASAMRFVGTASVALAAVMFLSSLAGGALNGLRSLPFGLAQAVGAAVMAVTGVWLRGASRAVEQIVKTEGNDVAHLMGAMRDLTRMFALQRTIFIASFAVGALALVASVVTLVLLAR